METGNKNRKVRKEPALKADLRARRQEARNDLSSVDNLYFRIVQNANDGIIIHDSSGRIYEVNRTMYQRLGYTRDEMLGMRLQDLVAPGFREKIKARTSRLEQDGVAIFESADIRKDGTVLPVEVSARFIEYDGINLIQSIVRDIQERKTAEDLVQHALRLKEMLVKELKYRVRLHHEIYIMGLESLSQYGEMPVPSDILKNQIRRIKATDFVLDRIYSYSNLTNINFSQIASLLMKRLLSLYAVDARRLRFELNVEDIFLDVQRSCTCAQILIELVGNAIQHAFPGTRSGSIRTRMFRREKEGFTLSVFDDGVGTPEGLESQSPQTLGMRLVRDLVHRLDGSLEIEANPGTRAIIRFQ